MMRAYAWIQVAEQVQKQAQNFAISNTVILEVANPVLTLQTAKMWDYLHMVKEHAKKYAREVSTDYIGSYVYSRYILVW